MYYDLIFFLIATTSFGLVAFAFSDYFSQTERELAFVVQNLLNAFFFLVWGGYSADAYQYSKAFLGNPSVFEKEQLFYLLGFILDKLVDQPWPLKILSGGSVLLVGTACFFYFGRQRIATATLAVTLLHLSPAFFTLTGNALRQGFAAELLLLALIFYKERRYWITVGFLFLGYLFHETILVAMLIIPLLNLSKKWFALLLVLSPMVSLFLFTIFEGPQISEFLRKDNTYFTDPEGIYHYEKFLVAYGIAWTFLIKFVERAQDDYLARAYILLVTLACTFLMFEIPFDRILAYSEVLVSLVAALVLALVWGDLRRTFQVSIATLVIVLGIVLWTHPSMLRTFGYYPYY